MVAVHCLLIELHRDRACGSVLAYSLWKHSSLDVMVILLQMLSCVGLLRDNHHVVHDCSVGSHPGLLYVVVRSSNIASNRTASESRARHENDDQVHAQQDFALWPHGWVSESEGARCQEWKQKITNRLSVECNSVQLGLSARTCHFHG